MNFETGNSGNILRHAVIKTGPGCQQEGAFCQYLGSEIAPEVYHTFPDGYVMEKLEPARRGPGLLRLIEYKLQTFVWSRAAFPVSTEIPWREKLKIYSVDVPEWVIESEPCLVHGDPTASNALIRMPIGEVILSDPRPPRDYIPQTKETDMGRILQSMLDWEVFAYDVYQVPFREPEFMKDNYYRAAAFFWCGAAAARIEYLEKSRLNRPNILDWCRKTRKICNV